jgi:tRNA(Ile)-lysidine synthase TilS/MesJ
MICKNCVLTTAIPSVRIAPDGICNYCHNFKSKESLDQQRVKLRQKFEALISTHKAAKDASTSSLNHKPSTLSTYDVLVAYSGGKDSTFTLDLLKNHYDLRILALTFDHGFVSPYALENIKKVVETLGIDHITFKPDFLRMREIFCYSIEHEFHPPKALERASSICNSCMGLVKFITLRTAIEKGIPFIAYGWSPGQAPIQSAILKNHPSFVRKTQQLFLQPLEKAAGLDARAYFLDDSHLDNDTGFQFPYNINPLAFLHYDEEDIYDRIRELGWQSPQDTDPNSTNCLMNAFANQVHLQRHGYHPYAMELAELVREGVLTREEALHRLSEEPNQNIIEKVKQKLGL